MRLLFVIATCLCLQASLCAQATFQASVSNKAPSLDQYVQLTFTLTGARNGSNFSPPVTLSKDFEIINGPRVYREINSINGRSQVTIKHSYTIRAKRTGTIRIAQGSIKADGKLLKSKPISLQVKKANPNAAQQIPDGQQYFIRLEASHDTAFVGQQVNLQVVLYTLVNIGSYRYSGGVNAKNARLRESMRFSNTATGEKVINGKKYTTKIIRELSLIPLELGRLNVSAAQAAISTDPGSNSTWGFGGFGSRFKRISSNSLNIDVIQYPRNRAYSNFGGAVGKYVLQASLLNGSAAAGESIDIRTVLKGNGEIKMVEPPRIEFDDPDAFEVYDVDEIDTNEGVSNGGFFSSRTDIHHIQAKKGGRHRISVVATILNPDSLRYEEIRKDLIVRVTGEMTAVTSTDVAAGGLEPALQSPQLSKPWSSFWWSPFFWGMLLGCLILVGIFGFYVYQNDAFFALPLLQQNYLLAHKRYNENRAADTSLKGQLFALKRFIADKTKTPIENITNSNLQEILLAKGASEETAASTVQAMQAATAAQYLPGNLGTKEAIDDLNNCAPNLDKEISAYIAIIEAQVEKPQFVDGHFVIPKTVTQYDQPV